MNRKKLISLLGLLVILIAIPVGIGALYNSGFEFRIAALEDDEPVNVVISDVSSDSFKVSWITEREVIGGILLTDGTRASESDRTSFHSVEISGLNSLTTYEFKLLSGTKEFMSEDGSEYLVKTASVSKEEDSFLIYGQIFSPDGYTFQQGGVISLQLSNSLLDSQTLSTVINETGGYQFDLSGLLSNSLTQVFLYKEECDVTFNIFVSHEQEGLEKEYTVEFSANRQVPNIYLGEVNIDIIPGVEGE